MSIQPSHPNPKFVSFASTLITNFGFNRVTSKFMILVWFLNLKYASKSAANLVLALTVAYLTQIRHAPDALFD